MNSGKQGNSKSEPKNSTRRERIDRFFHNWGKFRFYRLLCTLLLVFLVFVWARSYSIQKEAAQLKFVETASEQTHGSGSSSTELVKPALAGEAYETALRLRESGALLMAMSLSSFEDFRVNGKFPATVSEMLTNLRERELLPPGIEIKNGKFLSSLSTLSLNYRSDPFSFEIFSRPVNNADGPAILFRFPLPPAEANSIMYFEALSTVQQPPPFGTSEQMTAAGWKIRHWRGEALPLNETSIRELHEHDEWLKSQNPGRK